MFVLHDCRMAICLVGKDHLHHSYQRIGESWLLDVCFDHDCKERWHAIDTWAAGTPLHHSSDCSLSAASHHLSTIDFRILGSGRVKSKEKRFHMFSYFFHIFFPHSEKKDVWSCLGANNCILWGRHECLWCSCCMDLCYESAGWNAVPWPKHRRS